MNACGTRADECDPSGSKDSALAVDEERDLALEHAERLVGVGMQVHRRDLPPVEQVLEQQERAAGLRGRL